MQRTSILRIALGAGISFLLPALSLNAQSSLSGHLVAGRAWASRLRAPTPNETTRFLFGGGGELRAGRVLGVGADIVTVSNPGPAKSNGLFALNGYWHFLETSRSLKWDPYVAGGYSVLFRPGSNSGWNLGGGVNCWFRPRVGLRVEARDSVFTEFGGRRHWWTARLGLMIR